MINIFRISALILSIFLIHSCKKDKPALPIITTIDITEVSYTTATSGGDITNEGGASLISMGVCWNTSAFPTIANSMTIDSGGLGAFTSNLTQLTQNTLYYVRAYVTNSACTGYGNQVSFTTSQVAVPVLTTKAVTAITQKSAVSGGNITDDRGGFVTARGVCWSTEHNPTIESSKTTNGSDTGSFASSITGLTLGIMYYVRAYAINSIGTSYGNEVSFLTALAPGDSYQGGRIAYILKSGDPGYIEGETHGLIAAPSNQNIVGAEGWGCFGTAISGADGTAIGKGNQNTIDIMNGCSIAGIAARLCGDLVLGGYSDWYLPSKDELEKLVINKEAIGGFSCETVCWSSSEFNDNEAWFGYFTCKFNPTSPSTWHYQKNSPYSVRAIRSF